jgi:hypothetical protein
MKGGDGDLEMEMGATSMEGVLERKVWLIFEGLVRMVYMANE